METGYQQNDSLARGYPAPTGTHARILCLPRPAALRGQAAPRELPCRDQRLCGCVYRSTGQASSRSPLRRPSGWLAQIIPSRSRYPPPRPDTRTLLPPSDTRTLLPPPSGWLPPPLLPPTPTPVLPPLPPLLVLFEVAVVYAAAHGTALQNLATVTSVFSRWPRPTERHQGSCGVDGVACVLHGQAFPRKNGLATDHPPLSQHRGRQGQQQQHQRQERAGAAGNACAWMASTYEASSGFVAFCNS